MYTGPYPSEWMYGRPGGYIRPFRDAYEVITVRKLDRRFKYADFESLDAAYQAAYEFAIAKSTELGILQNRIRYIDEKTIRVSLTRDNSFMITDAENLDLVRRLDLTLAKTPSGAFRVKYDKGNSIFANLLVNSIFVAYHNKDPLDCRICNLDTNKAAYRPSQNHAQYFGLIYDQLPENTWILGKPMGWISNAANDGTWKAFLEISKGDSRQDKVSHSRTIRYGNNPARAYKELSDWLINTSGELGCTRNMVTIQGDIIYVKIDDTITMITDKALLPLVQAINIVRGHAIKDDNPNRCCVKCCINGNNIGFHRLITGFRNPDIYVDHINGNPLDNRLVNLRIASRSLNISNRAETPGSKVGVSPRPNSEDIRGYEAHLDYNYRFYSRCFSANGVKTLQQAYTEAVEYRVVIFEIHPGQYNTLSSTIPATETDRINIEAMMDRVNQLIDILNKERSTPELYLAGLTIEPAIHAMFYQYYNQYQDYHMNVLYQKLDQLQADLEQVNRKLASIPRS